MNPTRGDDLPQPWLSTYAGDTAARFAPRYRDALSLFEDAVARAGEAPAIKYFDASLSYSDLDRISDRFAHWLIAAGIEAGDRVALFMQSIPQFVICLVGAWKAGMIAVTVNPMSRPRELRLLLQDSDARVLVTQRDLHRDVACQVLHEFPGVRAVTTSPRDLQWRTDARIFTATDLPADPGIPDLMSLLVEGDGAVASRPRIDSATPAMIVYTSGTTGVPKGAVVSHGGLAFEADLWRAWVGLEDGAPVLGIAPLFHITGIGGHIALAFAAAAPLILTMRFHPDVISEAAFEHQAAFAVGAITAFIAIMNSPQVQPRQLRTLRHVFSGGAPVPTAVAREFARKFDLEIHNCYGLTESTSLAVAVPCGCRTPTDANGALSIGVPVFATDAYVAGDAGQRVSHGQVGEIMLRGPQIVSGYWQRPRETDEALLHGYLRTGDVGCMDEAGWLYLVDRKKDLIIASGYKVWPKEVEDVLYMHPAIREAAVVGAPDSYRGETVKAVISLKPGQTLNEDELVDFCNQHLAAYKRPRLIKVVPELPKTLTGKILRRELR